jgi:hypothetical protein
MEKDAGQFGRRKCREAIARKEKIRWNFVIFLDIPWVLESIRELVRRMLDIEYLVCSSGVLQGYRTIFQV